jgi:hypothetical protein
MVTRQAVGNSNNRALLLLKIINIFGPFLIFLLIFDFQTYTVAFILDVIAFAIFDHKHMITGIPSYGASQK